MKEDMRAYCDCEEIYRERVDYGLKIVLRANQARILMSELEEVMEGNNVHNKDVELVFIYPHEAYTFAEWYSQMQDNWRDERNK